LNAIARGANASTAEDIQYMSRALLTDASSFPGD
jgi:hypothetical protein